MSNEQLWAWVRASGMVRTDSHPPGQFSQLANMLLFVANQTLTSCLVDFSSHFLFCAMTAPSCLCRSVKDKFQMVLRSLLWGAWRTMCSSVNLQNCRSYIAHIAWCLLSKSILYILPSSSEPPSIFLSFFLSFSLTHTCTHMLFIFCLMTDAVNRPLE